jgi:hypothetical protein
MRARCFCAHVELSRTVKSLRVRHGPANITANAFGPRVRQEEVHVLERSVAGVGTRGAGGPESTLCEAGTDCSPQSRSIAIGPS